MSNRYFTADLHFGSTNILKYAKRPFSSAEDAVVKLCQNVNATVGYADMLIHVGDFMLAKSDKHDTIEDIGLNYKKEDYLAMLKPRVFLLAGNHDDHNACEPDAKSMTIDLNQNYVNVTVAHYPSYHEHYRYIGNGNRNSLSKNFIRIHPKLANMHIHICGHVHDKWLLNYDKIHNVLNVNVSVDVWNYSPVKDSDLTKMLDFIFDMSGPNRSDFSRNFTWSRNDFEFFRKCQNHDRKIFREQRKKERYMSKGLTPEECERRKIEAMKAKGLI